MPGSCYDTREAAEGLGGERHIRTTLYKSLQTTSTGGRDVTWEICKQDH